MAACGIHHGYLFPWILIEGTKISVFVMAAVCYTMATYLHGYLLKVRRLVCLSWRQVHVIHHYYDIERTNISVFLMANMSISKVKDLSV